MDKLKPEFTQRDGGRPGLSPRSEDFDCGDLRAQHLAYPGALIQRARARFGEESVIVSGVRTQVQAWRHCTILHLFRKRGLAVSPGPVLAGAARVGMHIVDRFRALKFKEESPWDA